MEKARRWITIYRDGREVLNAHTVKGVTEYRRRVAVMWTRQNGNCCLCLKPLRLIDATFDHTVPRGMGGGTRDDRIEINGRAINGAAHWLCNSEKGSRRDVCS
jgi:hypothetical protein